MHKINDICQNHNLCYGKAFKWQMTILIQVHLFFMAINFFIPWQ